MFGDTTRLSYKVVRGQQSGGLSSIIIPDPTTGENQTISEPEEVTDRICARNMHHFHQADGTPFTQPHLQTTCKLPFIDALIQLHSYKGQGNDAFDTIIHELSKYSAEPDPTIGLVDGNSLAQKFRKWKEATSTSLTNRHLGLNRAILKAPNPTIVSQGDDITVTSEDNLAGQADHGAEFFHCIS